MLGVTILGMIVAPALAEIAGISQTIRRSGQMSIMDEVSVLDNLMQPEFPR